VGSDTLLTRWALYSAEAGLGVAIARLSSIYEPAPPLGIRLRWTTFCRGDRDHALAAVRTGYVVLEPAWQSPVGFKVVYRQATCSGETLYPARFQDPVGVMTSVGLHGERAMVFPARPMPAASCIVDAHVHQPPIASCSCGYHAARSVLDLAHNFEDAPAIWGVLVVTPLGRTLWHRNAWRAQSYWPVAAVTTLDAEVPPGWPGEIPVVRAAWVPGRAIEIARELEAEWLLSRAMHDRRR
jgi:hypothetical protein